MTIFTAIFQLITGMLKCSKNEITTGARIMCPIIKIITIIGDGDEQRKVIKSKTKAHN